MSARQPLSQQRDLLPEKRELGRHFHSCLSLYAESRGEKPVALMIIKPAVRILKNHGECFQGVEMLLCPARLWNRAVKLRHALSMKAQDGLVYGWTRPVAPMPSRRGGSKRNGTG